MPTASELLDIAVAVLRRGEVLTLDSVARRAEMTKAGVVHHFPTKQRLMIAVVDHVVDRWEAEFTRAVGGAAEPPSRLRAYVEYAFTAEFDASDLAVLADAHLREVLRERWIDRLAPWVGPAAGSGSRPAEHVAARLLADGAWFNQALGIPAMTEDERSAVYLLAMELIDTGSAPDAGPAPNAGSAPDAGPANPGTGPANPGTGVRS